MASRQAGAFTNWLGRALLHRLRMIAEPSGRGEAALQRPGRWCVVNEHGERSMAMAYDAACAFKALFGGDIDRAANGARTIAEASLAEQAFAVAYAAYVDPHTMPVWAREARCRICGCTDSHACPGGCWWLDVDRVAGVGTCSCCGGT